VGSGFTDRPYEDILAKLNVTKKPPSFSKKVDPNKPIQFRRASNDIIYWVKPAYKCLIRYQEITNDGLMRHPSFKGLL
jgi:bifunctional non-homologous end joining protein LigD